MQRAILILILQIWNITSTTVKASSSINQGVNLETREQPITSKLKHKRHTMTTKAIFLLLYNYYV